MENQLQLENNKTCRGYAFKKAILSLANLAEGIGDSQVRNRTIGGSAKILADYPSVCIVLNVYP